jgi:hypothetical protein
MTSQRMPRSVALGPSIVSGGTISQLAYPTFRG